MALDLVRPDDFGIESRHYYYLNRDKFGLSLDELAVAGVTDEKCRVNRTLIDPLLRAQAEFEQLGYRLIVKDGYRSPGLYRLVYEKRIAGKDADHFGKTSTKQLLNIDQMPHAAGNVVDIDLAPHDGSVMQLRSSSDGVEGHFYGFYKGKTDVASRRYQANQDLIKDVMFNHGFHFGSLREYWHFELESSK